MGVDTKGADNSVPNSDVTRVTSEEGGGAVAKAEGGGLTLRYQSDLPKLPVPPLKDTLQRYLRALEALQTPEDHERTVQVVKEFEAGEGKKLQARLESYADGKASFIEEFWDAAYLDQEEAIVLSLNPFFLLSDDPTPARGNQLARATNIIMSSLGFIHDLRTGQLPPDDFRGKPLDMHQYTRLFGTARVPTDHGCQIQVDDASRHIVVLRRGQFYWFEVMDSKHRPALTERELQNNLEAIIADADKLPQGQVAQGALGVLSTENRKLWAKMRQQLLENDSNRSCLEIVDSALFCVCLDDTAPESLADMATDMLCGTYKLDRGIQVGTCTNRFYDKLQIIVAANGAAGINFEHSGVDGHTVLRFVGDIYTDLILRFAKSINPATGTLFKAKISPWAKGGGGKKPNGKPSGHGESTEEEEELDVIPKKLEWELTPEVKLAVRFAEVRLSDLICQNEIEALEFENYGKLFITRHGFSPDAFVQAAFQAAYFSLYGRMESTYEPAMVKAFLHGRTEAIRTATPEMAHFVQTFCSDATARRKIDALRKAVKGHTELTKKCSAGLGQDRILYAMYCMIQQDVKQAKKAGKPAPELPSLFADPGYATLNHTTLSTSNCGNPALRLFGFGPVVPDGFGIGYIIKDDAISICAASKHLQTRRFLETLRAYLLDAKSLILQLYREANQRPDLHFVDHHARTGRPIAIKDTSKSHNGNGNGASHDDDNEDRGFGYDFFGESDTLSKVLGSSRQKRRANIGNALNVSDY